MTLDIRSTLLTAWLTFLMGTIGSTLMMASTDIPDSLTDASFIYISLWLAVITVGMWTVLLGWHNGRWSAFWSVLVGYGAAALLRLMFQGVFLQGSSNEWSLFWGLFTFSGIPPYLTFLLLVFVGGAVLAGISVMFNFMLARLLNLPPEGFVPQVVLEQRVFWGILGWMPIGLLTLVMLGTLGVDGEGKIQLSQTNWLTLPVTNMILASLIGFFVGLFYLCPDSLSAGLTLLLGLCTHILLIIPLGEMLDSYDVVGSRFDANDVSLLSFLFLMVATPAVGSIAAFALHNLRDAFRIPPSEPELPPIPQESEA